MSYSPEVVSLFERLEARARDTAAEYAAYDLMSKMFPVSAEAVQKMRDLGATSADIARHFRFVASELDAAAGPEEPPTARSPLRGS